MAQSVVGKWGKNLAIRVPMQVARAAGLTDGEKVEVETQDGDIVVRRRRRASGHARMPGVPLMKSGTGAGHGRLAMIGYM